MKAEQIKDNVQRKTSRKSARREAQLVQKTFEIERKAQGKRIKVEEDREVIKVWLPTKKLFEQLEPYLSAAEEKAPQFFNEQWFNPLKKFPSDEDVQFGYEEMLKLDEEDIDIKSEDNDFSVCKSYRCKSFELFISFPTSQAKIWAFCGWNLAYLYLLPSNLDRSSKIYITYESF